MPDDPPDAPEPPEIDRIRELFADATGMIEDLYEIAVGGQAPGLSHERYGEIARKAAKRAKQLSMFLERCANQQSSDDRL